MLLADATDAGLLGTFANPGGEPIPGEREPMDKLADARRCTFGDICPAAKVSLRA